MSKHDELTALAVEQAKAIRRWKEECQALGQYLVQGLADFLGCPDYSMMYLTVDQDLRIGGPGGNIRGDPPTLTLRDGVWYFGIRILFGDHSGKGFAHQGYRNEVKMLLGVKRHDDGGFTVRSDKDMKVALGNPASLKAFCQAEYESIKDFLSAPITGPKKRIGFVPPGSED